MQKPSRRPRVLTLTLPNQEQPYLVFNSKRYLLRNFSEDGIGVWMPPPAPYGLTPGNRVQGDIEMGGVLHPVTLEVVHQHKGSLGLKILSKSKDLESIFRKILSPLGYAIDLKPHAKSGQWDSENALPRLWYHNEKLVELLIWCREGDCRIEGLQLSWLGQWVYRLINEKPKTGFLKEENSVGSGKLIPLSDLIACHTEADQSLLQQAAQFLTVVPYPLPGHLLWQFLETGEQVFLPDGFLNMFQHLKRAS